MVSGLPSLFDAGDLQGRQEEDDDTHRAALRTEPPGTKESKRMIDEIKAAHICGQDCGVGDVSYSPTGVLGQYHFHRDGDNDCGWADDIFVGPRAVYVLFDGDGEYDLPFAAPLNADQQAYWADQIVSGPYGSRGAAFPVAA